MYLLSELEARAIIMEISLLAIEASREIRRLSNATVTGQKSDVNESRCDIKTKLSALSVRLDDSSAKQGTSDKRNSMALSEPAVLQCS